MFKFISSHSERKRKTEQFNHLMRRARQIAGSAAEHKNEALLDLIKIVMRPVQAEHIRNAYISEAHGAIRELNFSKDWFGTQNSFDFYTALPDESPKKQHTVNLSSDIVLPTCWHPASLSATIGVIGRKNRKCGEFAQSANHSVLFLLPMRIGFVINGNHSIAQGIICGNGQIVANEVVDLTDKLTEISFDGVYWRDRQNNKIGTPRYAEFGWVWEISKLLS